MTSLQIKLAVPPQGKSPINADVGYLNPGENGVEAYREQQVTLHPVNGSHYIGHMTLPRETEVFLRVAPFGVGASLEACATPKSFSRVSRLELAVSPLEDQLEVTDKVEEFRDSIEGSAVSARHVEIVTNTLRELIQLLVRPGRHGSSISKIEYFNEFRMLLEDKARANPMEEGTVGMGVAATELRGEDLSAFLQTLRSTEGLELSEEQEEVINRLDDQLVTLRIFRQNEVATQALPGGKKGLLEWTLSKVGIEKVEWLSVAQLAKVKLKRD